MGYSRRILVGGVEGGGVMVPQNSLIELGCQKVSYANGRLHMNVGTGANIQCAPEGGEGL